MNRRLPPAAALLFAATTAAAQATIYRCGADGRSYSQVPCADGQAIALAPGPSATAQAEARAVAAREAALARRLTEERRARHAHVASAVARPAPPGARAIAASSVDTERPSRRAKVPKTTRAASGR